MGLFRFQDRALDLSFFGRTHDTQSAGFQKRNDRSRMFTHHRNDEILDIVNDTTCDDEFGVVDGVLLHVVATETVFELTREILAHDETSPIDETTRTVRIASTFEFSINLGLGTDHSK